MKKTLATLLVLAMVASLVGVMFVSADTTNLALGKEVANAEVNGDNKNYSADLTDGKTMDKVTYEPGDWFGYWYNANVEASVIEEKSNADENGNGIPTIDLGETCTVDTVRVHLGVNTDSGIGAPTSIIAQVSADGETFTDVATKNEFPAEVAWAEFDMGGISARYVRLVIDLGGTWAFLDEIEVLGTAGASAGGDESSDESNGVETIDEVIDIDGSLEDTGYTKATWMTSGVWQNTDFYPETAIEAAYTVRTDDENVYIAVKVVDDVAFATALAPEAATDTKKFSQAGASNFRIWMSGDGMFAKNEDGTVKTDDAGNNVRARTFYDLLWDGEKFVPFREKVATEELTFAVDTADGTIELEIKVAKSALNITDSFDMMVTYSAPDLKAAEGVEDEDGLGYNGFHISPYKAQTDDEVYENGKLPADWSATLVMYANYTCEATKLGTYEVDLTPEPEPDPVEEYKKELEALVGADNENADFDLVLKSETTKDGKVVVTVTVENIKEGANLQGVFAKITYDDTKLKLTTGENSDGSLAFGNITVPSDKWENVSAVVTEEVVAEDGTKSEVKTNVIDFNFTNADDESIISADTPFVVTIEFELLENCTYGGVYAASADVESLGLDGEGEDKKFVDYVGNGSYTVAELPVDEDNSSSEPPAKPGDTGVIVFAVLGVIAIAGAAVVIKARH